MANDEFSRSDSTAPSLDDEEDNNPFPYLHGLTSLINDQGSSKVLKSGGRHTNGDAGPPNNSDDDESVLLYNSPNQSDSKLKETFKSVQINYESRVSRLLKPGSNIKLNIVKAGNSNEGFVNSLKTYIVYTIQLVDLDDPNDEIQTRRRYSDFESLREVLCKIFPLVIIPPIPPKNYLKLPLLGGLVGNNSNHAGNGNGENQSTNSESPPLLATTDYSYINSTHLNKNRLIEHRKRLLFNFLNNCLSIPQIRNLDFFAKFLDPNSNWSDEISLLMRRLPRSIYLLNPENGLNTDPIYLNLPNPTNSHAINMSFLKPLHDNGKKITTKTNKILGPGGVKDGASTSRVSSEKVLANENQQYVIDTSCLDNINKKIMFNFNGLANDYTELGSIFNSFSLILAESPVLRSNDAKNSNSDEDLQLSTIFDKIGQVFDRSFVVVSSMIAELETKFSEPLGEAVQYSSILEFINKYHKRKIRQQEILENELVETRSELKDLSKAEEESCRIKNAVHSRILSKDPNYDLSTVTSPAEQDTSKAGSHESYKQKYLPSFKRITQYISDIMDQNPEETRKQKISLLHDKVTTYEKCQKIMHTDLVYIADEIDKNFKLFHKKQLKVLFKIMRHYNNFLASWAKKNVEIWEEIRLEISKI